jgi:hypothetical protein
VSPGLHSVGALSARTLDAIARAAHNRQIRHSVETGSGASTLLFSHLSDDHTVFALDDGNGSITNVRRSPLLRQSVVTFVEGPTQATLPQYRFTEKLKLVLIDGPHGYPFPELEYYFRYPHLETGALLILDDIQIPSTTSFSFCGETKCSNWIASFKRLRSSTERARRSSIHSGTAGGCNATMQNPFCAKLGWTRSEGSCLRRCREASCDSNVA